jgi:hypothetical protein
MFNLKCPLCGSKRIKRGYRETPFLWRIIGKHYLLCSRCNWEFDAVILFSGLPSRSQRRRYKEEEKLEDWLAKQEKPQSQIDTIIKERRIVKETELSKAAKLTDETEMISDGKNSHEISEDDWLAESNPENLDKIDDEILEIDFNSDRIPVKVKNRLRLRLKK